jgi:hypothetical protein
MENSYEVRFCRPDGRLSLLMQAHFASDREALESTGQMLSARAPSASVERLECDGMQISARRPE